MRTLQISDSQLSTWYFCNRRYGYERVDRFRPIGAKPDYFQEGSVMHKGLEAFYRLGIVKDGVPAVSYSDRIEAAMEAMTKMACTSDEIEMQGETLDFLQKTMLEYADFYKNDGWKVIAVEQPFSTVLYETEDTDEAEGLRILYEGINDLVIEEPGGEDGLIAVDHKTSRSFRSVRHPSNLSGQFVGYTLPFDSTKVVENKVGFQKTYPPKDKFVRHPITFDQHVIEEWKGWTIVQALKIDQAIQQGYWEPNYASCRRNCPFAAICWTRPSIREWKLMRDYLKVPESNRTIYKGNYDAD